MVVKEVSGSMFYKWNMQPVRIEDSGLWGLGKGLGEGLEKGLGEGLEKGLGEGLGEGSGKGLGGGLGKGSG